MKRENLSEARRSALLSFIFNGLGQIYNGEIKKGLWLFFGSGFSLLIFLIGAVFLGYSFLSGEWKILFRWGLLLFVLGIIGIIVIGIYSINDAYKTGKGVEE